MTTFLSNNMDVVYLLYGACFIFMAVSIIVQSRRGSTFKLSHILWLLVCFAMFHGINEWGDVLSFIHPKNTILDYLGFFTRFAAFLFLLEFGVRLYTIDNDVPYLKWWITAMMVIVTLTLSYASGQFMKTGAGLTRYFMAFPGSLFTAIGFYRYCYNKEKMPLHFCKYFLSASAAFLFYAFVGGMFIKNIGIFPSTVLNYDTFLSVTGIPVQVFRAISGMFAALSIVGVLRLFNWEAQEKLQDTIVELSDKKARLQQSEEYLKVTLKEKEALLENLKSERSLLETAHTKITDSIQYASMIQNVILPDDTVINRYFSEHFVIWQPKDIVGGDIYIIDALMRDECIVSVIDCTGHGVPGAFVTMLVSTIWPNVVDGISTDSGGITPGRILSTFSKSIRELLKQDVADCQSNVGLDGGVLYLNRKHHIVRYAGANVNLLMCRKGKVDVIKGNRHGVGYKNSDPNYVYNNVEIDITSGDMLYITTDGYIDQNGGDKDLPFGRSRLVSIIENNWHRPMAEQRDALLVQLCSYQGKSDRTDDITVVGLKI
ncbi:serine phosphatase [Candidatus Magnetobacterium bavaricum]|uniref:Serine phosphatase n=1 Tax=Candidatus Magnetobacterium bavaricum TaxID=29290 RepID=A0A0F3H0C9_9BACT|nr:serine phosphatase [Candidatus Magnetobacterium bavaricum]